MSTPNNNHHHHHLLRPPPPPPPHHHHRAGGGGGTTAAGTTRPFVLVPLYIYPAPQAWAPLYEAAAAHPDLDFLVVVNPANGPGAGSLPDANYVEALARLTAARNVRVIGYVHCSYGKRLAEDVVADVEAYGRWEGEMGRVREGEKAIVVDGIFIDETPSSTELVEYMATLANAAKTILNRNVIVPASLVVDGAAESRTENGKGEGQVGGEWEQATGGTTTTSTAATPATNAAEVPEVSAATPSPATTTTTNIPAPATAEDGTDTPQAATPSAAGALTPSLSSAVVIYNPGVVVDPIFYQAADYVVAFENSARAWSHPAVAQGWHRLPRPLAARSVAVAHGAGGGLVEVGQMCRRAAEAGCGGLFVTSRPGYTEWCPSWREFVEDIARRTMV